MPSFSPICGIARRAPADHFVRYGLYGSTLRWLERGLPHIKWSCVLLARSNYKGFRRNILRALAVSLSNRTDISLESKNGGLSFWHLIESVLEPKLQSVKSFRMVAGSEEPRSNLEIEKWRTASIQMMMVMNYSPACSLIRSDSMGCNSQDLQDAARAWRRLRRIIIWPKPADVELLTTGDRSCDFGSSAAIPALSARGAAGCGAFCGAVFGVKAKSCRRFRSLGVCFWQASKAPISAGTPIELFEGSAARAFSYLNESKRDSQIVRFMIQAACWRRRPACMAKALSIDLRRRVVDAIEQGLSCRQAAVRFGISASSAIRWRGAEEARRSRRKEAGRRSQVGPHRSRSGLPPW